MQTKIRVLHVIVQPVLVCDDGNELSPGPEAQPVRIPLSELAGAGGEILSFIEKIETNGPEPSAGAHER